MFYKLKLTQFNGVYSLFWSSAVVSSLEEYQVTSVTRAQVIIDPWVRSILNKISIKMKNTNSNQCGTQMTKTKATMHLRDTKGKMDQWRQRKCYPLLFKKQSYTKTVKKRMIEITSESVWFNTSQRLSDQARLVLKKGWFFFYLKILEICEQLTEEHNKHVKIPSRPPPRHINFFEPFHFLAGDQLVVLIGASHVSS